MKHILAIRAENRGSVKDQKDIWLKRDGKESSTNIPKGPLSVGLFPDGRDDYWMEDLCVARLFLS